MQLERGKITGVPTPPLRARTTLLSARLEGQQSQDEGAKNMRLITTAVGICFLALAAHAASPKVDSASQVFQSVGADPAKVKTYCEMSKTMDNAGDKPDQATDAKIQDYIKQLGPEFEEAWNTGNDLDENSEDGKTYAAALDTLSNKCS
jgi:hypothetical protein